ncbi:hypothetical protein NCS55_00486200 [Fusarium keratoplasticum]|nr:hypothetical protein NCS55_00486200 [Fusarium keratoplasticum]
MSLSDEVDQIQRDLSDLKTRLDLFESKSKTVIKADHDKMLAELRKSVASVEGSISYLETGQSPLAGYLEYLASSSSTATSRALVKRHVADMNSNFSNLREAAGSALTRVEQTKKTCDDMYNELGAIRLKLESVTTRTKSALSFAKETLTEKKKKVAEANASLQSTQQQLRELEAKMKDEKDARDVMRVVRVISWSATVFFPPAALLAGTAEAIAASWREDREKLRGEITSANTQIGSLTSEVSKAQAQAAALEKTVREARSLKDRVENMSIRSQQTRTLVCERLEEYQALKSSTDEFGAWTSELQGQTATAQVMSASSQVRLRRVTKKIVDTLLDKEQGDVKAICALT